MKVLIVTVGGSDAPIVTAIQKHKPDFVVFICSQNSSTSQSSASMVNNKISQTNKACLKCGFAETLNKKSIIEQCGLTDKSYRIEFVPPDNPYDTYEKTLEIIDRYQNSAEINIDYTGGTKSMSSGAVAAALKRPFCKLSVVTGPRSDLIRVQDGLQTLRRLNDNNFQVRRLQSMAETFLRDWDYVAAAKVSGEILEQAHTEDAEKYQRFLILCQAFAAWNVFDYERSYKLLAIYRQDVLVKQYISVLEKILEAISALKTENFAKQNELLTLVYDILFNAERQATLEQYNYAIRLLIDAAYLHSRICLICNKPSLNACDINIDLLPLSIRPEYEKKASNEKLIVTATQSYEILRSFNNPIGALWENAKDKLNTTVLNFEGIYPQLLLRAFCKETYQDFRDNFWQFIADCDGTLKIRNGLASFRQLPTVLANEKNQLPSSNVAVELPELKTESKLQDFATTNFSNAAKTEKTLWQECFNKNNLYSAWQRVALRGGGAGSDGETVENFAMNAKRRLAELQNQLETGNYRSSKPKWFEVLKSDGCNRKLGMLSVKDKVVMLAIQSVLTRKLDSRFSVCSYAYRPRRSAINAAKDMETSLQKGYAAIINADIAGFFDNVSHLRLSEILPNWLDNDRRLFELITNSVAQTSIRPGYGLVQGSPLSPLLANIYLHDFDIAVIQSGHKMIRYADNFAVFCATAKDAALMANVLSNLLSGIGLRMNDKKTKIINCQEESFVFLGFTFYDKTKHPSPNAVAQLQQKLDNEHSPSGKRQIIAGWEGYFGKGWNLLPQETTNELDRYFELFIARSDVYGKYSGETRLGYITCRSEITKQDIMRHLGGDMVLGAFLFPPMESFAGWLLILMARTQP